MSNQVIDKEKMKFFWKKKTIVSFVLSVFVLFLHMSSFTQYDITGTQYEGVLSFLHVFLQKTFVVLAVPLFFIISGATTFRNYTNKDYPKKLVSRVKSLLIPYLIWNTINLLYAIITSYTFISNYFVGREKFVISLPNILLGIFFYSCYGPFWFIFNLMVFTIFLPLINLLISKKTVGISAIIALLILQFFDIKLPETIFFESESLVYYMLGCYIGKHHFDLFSSKTNALIRAISVGLFLVITVVFCVQGYGLFAIIEVPRIVIKIVYSMSFWIMVDYVIEKIPQKGFMSDSFIIYATHNTLKAIILKLFYMLMPKHPLMSIVSFVLCSVLTLIIICLFCAFMKKFLPKIYGVISGTKVDKEKKLSIRTL